MTDPIQFRRKVEQRPRKFNSRPAEVVRIKDAPPETDAIDAFHEQLCADELKYAINKVCVVLRPARAKLLLELAFSNALETLK